MLTPADLADLERLIRDLRHGKPPRRVAIEARAADALERWVRAERGRRAPLFIPTDPEAEARVDAWCHENEPVRAGRKP